MSIDVSPKIFLIYSRVVVNEMSQLSLSVDVAGLKLRNPTLNAAGVLGISAPLLKRVYEGGSGAVVTKSLGPTPRTGHLNPTMVLVDGGVLNAMGLPNPGAEYFVDAIKIIPSDQPSTTYTPQTKPASALPRNRHWRH